MMEELSKSHCDVNSFGRWQSMYAERGIATFPIGPNKKPLVSRYNRFGLRASAEIGRKYADAPAIGFMAGKRNRITIGDVDEVGEKPLQHFLDRHGSSPVIARTASGKHHVWYRHNNERRLIRPNREINVDILGGGFVVAPPSRGDTGKYQFIVGGLDDLDKLPVMQNVPTVPGAGAETLPSEVKEGERNNTLFRIVGRGAHQVDDFDQLLDYARTRNSDFAQPLPDEEVLKVAASVWKMQCEGRNWFGQFGAYVPLELSRKLARTPDACALYGVLKAENGPTSVFPIANGMAETAIGLRRYRLANARKVILGLGLVEQVSPQTQHKPALYRWPRVQGADS